MMTKTAFAYLREKAGMTVDEVAELCGKTKRTVYRWENGESQPGKLALEKLGNVVSEARAGYSVQTFTFIDLFAGIGGLRRGFEALGGRCVYTSEWNRYSQITYTANYTLEEEIAGDITQVAAEDIPQHDLLLAGFPCQPFSIAGVSKKNALHRPHGFRCEAQGTLFFDVARIIEHHRPRAFMLENVKNLVNHDKGKTFKVIRRTLEEELGYNVSYKVIDARSWVPQHRERIIIVGFRDRNGFTLDNLRVPDPASEPVLANVLHPEDGSEIVGESNKRYVDPNGYVKDKYTLTDHLWNYLQDYARKHREKGNGFGYGLVGPEDIARTLSARYYKDGSEILIKRQGGNPRRLTPRECARLMGFDDTFIIPVSDTQAYKQFSQAAVLPMIESVAKVIVPQLILEKEAEAAKAADTAKNIMINHRWTREELKLAFHLYCQLPFGRLHSRNPEIIQLARAFGRTPSAVAMKLVNFASLDPAITDTGRKGLTGASNLDREIWDEFHADWETLALECEVLRRKLGIRTPLVDEINNEVEREDYTGETRKVITEQRIKQAFFRRAVLSSYKGRCCMSGLSEPRLLVASHIVPWSKDKANRLNPSNGLCLSAIHDRAFDEGLITLSDDFRIIVSDELKRRDEVFIKEVMLPLDGHIIEPPERFVPRVEFITWHRNEHFVDSRK